ncbi:MAG TPA: DUF1918 domain-containing protein [Micromonosporaceae bacterium]|jgi:hypothetical protein|nr:DUF1918 domain-containing protein [Micromonosporaceae bacterium]
MNAHTGDRLVLEGTHVGDPRRAGVIIGLRHKDGTPPYEVRWLDTGHVALVFPGPDARVEPPTHRRGQPEGGRR